MARYFTRDQAHALLPAVEQEIRQALSMVSDFRDAEQEIRAVRMHVMVSGGASLDPVHMSEIHSRRERYGGLLKQRIESIQEHGCLVKDLDLGLVDFPTLYRGEEVYLCWRLGERAIEFWHGIEEGFRGRKPIDADFLANHRGDV